MMHLTGEASTEPAGQLRGTSMPCTPLRESARNAGHAHRSQTQGLRAAEALLRSLALWSPSGHLQEMEIPSPECCGFHGLKAIRMGRCGTDRSDGRHMHARIAGAIPCAMHTLYSLMLYEVVVVRSSRVVRTATCRSWRALCEERTRTAVCSAISCTGTCPTMRTEPACSLYALELASLQQCLM